MDLTDQMNDLFAELRSLMHAPEKEEGWGDAVLALVKQARGVSPGIFKEEWLPYLRTASPAGADARVTSLGELRRLVALLPRARFALELTGRLTKKGANLADSPLLSSLHTLSLVNTNMEQKELAALVASPELASLKAFETRGHRFTESAVSAIVKAEWEALRELSICDETTRDGGAKEIARCEAFGSLEVLALDRDDLYIHGAAALVSSKTLTSLRTLSLDFNEIGAVGLRNMARVFDLPSLRSLSLVQNKISFEGIEALADAPGVSSLEVLDLYLNNTGDHGAEALARSSHLSSLRSLKLGSNHIGARGAKALADAASLSSLAWLNLQGNKKIGREGVDALVHSEALALKGLSLSFCELGDDEAKLIANSPRMESLERLMLDYNNIGYEGVRALAESPYLSNLQALSLSGEVSSDLRCLECLANASNMSATVRAFYADWYERKAAYLSQVQ